MRQFGTVLALVLLATLVSTAGVVAADGAQETGDVPDPLEQGIYGNQTIDSGETITYEAELTEGDYFAVGAYGDSGENLEIAIYAPDGSQVGEGDQEGFNGAELIGAPVSGTYTVEVYNPNSPTTFTLEVYQTESVDEGVHDGEAITEFIDLYAVEVAEGETLTLTITAQSDGAVEMGLFDSELNFVDSASTEGDGTIQVADGGAGMYYFNVYATGGAPVDYQVEVSIDEDVGQQDDGDDVPQPLETGFYESQSIDGGAYDVYEAELTEGDVLVAGANYDASADVRVTVYGPDGTEVGETNAGDAYQYVEAVQVPTDGTYHVEVYNPDGAERTYDLEVYIERREVDDGDDVPNPLEAGSYQGQSLDSGASVDYAVELTENDYFVAGAEFAPEDGVEVTVYGPDGTRVGETHTSDDYHVVEVEAAPTAGTYHVEVTNPGTGETPYDFFVEIQRIDTGEDGDDVPEPLEPGYYEDQTIGPEGHGSHDSYEVELTEGDSFTATVWFDDTVPAEIALFGPNGGEVGEIGGGDHYTYVEATDVPTTGTYTLSIANVEDTEKTYDLEVNIDRTDAIGGGDDVPEPLRSGSYEELSIDAGETLVYEADIDEDQYFGVWTQFTGGDLEVTIVDPNGNEVGDGTTVDGFSGAWVLDPAIAGTYTVEVSNQGGVATTFDLQVNRAGIQHAETGVYSGEIVADSQAGNGFVLYEVQLEDGGSLSATARGEQSDLGVAVYNDALETLDRTQGSGEQYAEITDASAGTYYVEVYALSGDTDYELEVAVEGSGSGAGAVAVEDATVTAVAGSEVTIPVTVTAEGSAPVAAIVDPSLEALPADWTVVDRNDDGGVWQADDGAWLFDSLTDEATPGVTVAVPEDASGTVELPVDVQDSAGTTTATVTIVVEEQSPAPAAVDADGDGTIDDGEILEAIEAWRTGDSLEDLGRTLTNEEILELIELWRDDERVDGGAR